MTSDLNSAFSKKAHSIQRFVSIDKKSIFFDIFLWSRPLFYWKLNLIKRCEQKSFSISFVIINENKYRELFNIYNIWNLTYHFVISLIRHTSFNKLKIKLNWTWICYCDLQHTKFSLFMHGKNSFTEVSKNFWSI